ncbi:MAG: CoA pyrophosphatase, partial [Candidatus Dadabacteria bacterium]|nr:CoA pyrophosphatase [Candidatus Dadabacteria bacterium]
GAARAAVMAVLRNRRDDVDLCMIKRSHHPLDRFSGHIALPGGAEEDGDEDMLSTAVRETFEEIGLDVEKHAKVAGRLDDEMPSVPPGGAGRVYVVTPFVCVLTGDAAVREKSEVEQVFWMPASDIARGAEDGAKPEFLCRGRRIWGMTARVVRNLLEALP